MLELVCQINKAIEQEGSAHRTILAGTQAKIDAALKKAGQVNNLEGQLNRLKA